MKRFLPSASVTLALLSALSVSPALAQRKPVTADMVDKAIAATEELAAKEIAANAVAGMAIAVVFEDKLVYSKGFGFKDTAAKTPVDADTVFQIASLSKSVGSTVMAALVGEGTVSWDSKISDLDPSFAMYDPWVTSQITVRDLYCHRSGLPEHSGDILEDIGFAREEILHHLRYQRPNTSFRSGYAYTNFGITEAAVAAAKAAGVEWETLSEEKLYKPLGMTSTSSRFADFMARPNRAAGHVLIDGAWVPKYQRQPDAQTPAGGVSSSVNDLAKWMRLQMAEGKFDGKQIVAAAPLAESHLPMMMTGLSPINGLPQFYGLGWNVGYDEEGRHRISHSGAFAMGTGTTVIISLDDRLGIVILTNSAPTGVAEGIGQTFMDTAFYGKSTQDWLPLIKGLFDRMAAAADNTAYDKPPTSPLSALADEAYLGTFSNDYFGDIEVVVADGGLAVQMGPQKAQYSLTHYDRDVFTYLTDGENSTGTTGVTFTVGGDGKAFEVVIDHLNVRGQGTFKRKNAAGDGG